MSLPMETRKRWAPWIDCVGTVGCIAVVGRPPLHVVVHNSVRRKSRGLARTLEKRVTTSRVAANMLLDRLYRPGSHRGESRQLAYRFESKGFGRVRSTPDLPQRRLANK